MVSLLTTTTTTVVRALLLVLEPPATSPPRSCSHDPCIRRLLPHLSPPSLIHSFTHSLLLFFRPATISSMSVIHFDPPPVFCAPPRRRKLEGKHYVCVGGKKEYSYSLHLAHFFSSLITIIWRLNFYYP